MNRVNSISKRSLDVILAGVGLIMLSPLLLLIALSIRISMGSPVLYLQPRPGYKGKIFTIYKFRSMTDERDKKGRLLPDGDRLNRVGRLIRSLSLDELPELINVLKGDMSLVGPRPLRVEYLERYSPEQARRHDVKPGITGWAQVNGRNAITWEEKFKLDVWYVDNRTLWLDIKILFMTLWRVVARQGISQEGQATMEKFLPKDDNGA